MHTRTKLFNRVCIVGLGYIGLPTAIFIASKGIEVVGADINVNLVDTINKGILPFVEPGLADMLQSVVSSGCLKASTLPSKADAYIICVPTPFKENHEVDTCFIKNAVESILHFLKAGDLLVLESTVPPGTTEAVANFVLERRPDLSVEGGAENAIFVAHCPETVLPGKITEEMQSNDRIIGGVNSASNAAARSLYETFVTAKIHEADARTAEMVKLSENAFRDVNIAFANELSLICERLNIDVWELIRLANNHPRVNILQPGPGVGGHCIAVDPWFIVSAAPEESKLIRTARNVNDTKPKDVVAKIQKIPNIEELRIGILGLSFKNDIDDLRESPSVKILKMLASENPRQMIRVVEPNIISLPDDLKAFNNVSLVELKEAIHLSDVIILLVNHKEFYTLTSRQLEGKIVIDTKGVFRETAC